MRRGFLRCRRRLATASGLRPARSGGRSLVFQALCLLQPSGTESTPGSGRRRSSAGRGRADGSCSLYAEGRWFTERYRSARRPGGRHRRLQGWCACQQLPAAATVRENDHGVLASSNQRRPVVRPCCTSRRRRRSTRSTLAAVPGATGRRPALDANPQNTSRRQAVAWLSILFAIGSTDYGLSLRSYLLTQHAFGAARTGLVQPCAPRTFKTCRPPSTFTVTACSRCRTLRSGMRTSSS